MVSEGSIRLQSKPLLFQRTLLQIYFQNATVMPVPSAYNELSAEKSLREHLGWVWYQTSFYQSKYAHHLLNVLKFESVQYYARVVSPLVLIVEYFSLISVSQRGIYRRARGRTFAFRVRSGTLRTQSECADGSCEQHPLPQNHPAGGVSSSQNIRVRRSFIFAQF